MTDSNPNQQTSQSVQPKGESGGFAKDVIKLTSGTTLAQALTLLAAPIFYRIFPPEAYGTAAVFTSITSIIGIISSLRYEFAIVLPEKDEDAANVFAVSLAAVVAVTVGSGLVLMLLAPYMLAWLNAPDLKPYLWLVPLNILVTGGFRALTHWNTRTRQFGRLSIARVFGAVMVIALQAVVILFGAIHAGGVILASIGGLAISAVVLGLQIWRDDSHLFISSIRWRSMIDSLVRYRKFPLIDSWGGFLNNLSWQLPPLLLSALFSSVAAGYYSLAYRLIHLPMSLIGASIAQIFFQRASAASNDRDTLIHTVKSVFERLTALGLLPSILITLVGPELFVFVFGENWLESGKYVQILGIWMFFWFISSPLSTIFTIKERQELSLLLHIVILGTRAISLLIGGYYGNVYLALLLFSGSGVLVYGGLAFWNMYLTGISWKYMFTTIIKFCLYSVPIAIILLVLKFGFHSPSWLIFVASGIATVVYYLWLLRKDEILWGFFNRQLSHFSFRRAN